MDFVYLLNILSKRKWLLLSVVLVSAAATWFFIGQLKPVYKAKTVISTGIIDYKGVSLQKDNPFIQKFQIESSFNGLTEKMKSRRSIRLVTERLLAHDILADGVQVKPFRIPEEDEAKGLSQNELDNLAKKLKTNNTDTSVNEKPHLEGADNKLAEAYGYDYESLLKKLEIQRVGETDYLSIEFKSESPELSYFVVNSFKEEFFKVHEEDLSHQENVALDFHTKQVDKRKQDLDAKIAEINQYKRANSLVDVSTQRETVISHLKDLELKKEEQNQQVVALQRQIPILNAKILEYNKVNLDDFSSTVFFNSDFQKLNEEIKALQVKLIDQVASGNRSTGALEARIELLKQEQSRYISKSVPVGSNKIKEGMATQVRQWITESLEKQMELEFAKAAVRGYEAEIQKQQGRAGKLLSDDSHLATLEAEKYRLEQEYLRATKEYDDAKLYSEGTENPLTVVEEPELPTEPEPSHRTLFSLFAGVASGTLTSIFLFLLAFVDSSIQSPSQFRRMTKLPLAGFVNMVKLKNMNLHHLFLNTQRNGELEIFKENIRKLRTAIENSGAKSFLFTSPKEQEGKSFLIVLLAYALSLNNKRVLIIDTNFKNNTLSEFKSKSYIELTTEPSVGPMGSPGTGAKQMPPEAVAAKEDPYLKNIDIVGNKGGSQSPSEVLAGKDFKKVMELYGKKYDYIFLEAAAMNKFSDARELIPFTDKILVVFSSQSPIGSADKDTFEFLQKMNGQLLGGILNKVDLKNI